MMSGRKGEPNELLPLKESVHVHYDADDDDLDQHDEHGFLEGFHTYSTRLSQRFSQRLSQGYHDGFIPLVRTFSEGVQTLSHPSFVLSERALDPDEDRRLHFRSAGTSTIVSEIANLSKNTIGGGVMSLSGGIALYASDPAAVISATGWVIGLGFLFGYFCWL